MTTSAPSRPWDTTKAEMHRHRLALDAQREREAAGIAEDAPDQLRSGYIYGWLVGALAINVLVFGYWLGGLAFLTGATQAVLFGAVLYLAVDLYREWRRDRIFWGAIRAYLARHDGRDKYQGR